MQELKCFSRLFQIDLIDDIPNNKDDDDIEEVPITENVNIDHELDFAHFKFFQKFILAIIYRSNR